jgi:hypothetical protein
MYQQKMNAEPEPAQRRVPHVLKPPEACLPIMRDEKKKKKLGMRGWVISMNKKGNEKDAGNEC